MRTGPRKELTRRFAELFELQFPRFGALPPDRGVRKWSSTVTPGLTLFVMLQPFEREDRFAVEVAWSDDGSYPWHAINPSPQTANLRGRQRLAPGGGREGIGSQWDLAPETTAARQAAIEALRRGVAPTYLPEPPVDELLPRARLAAEDAVNRLLEVGVPIFRRVAENRGSQWSPSEPASPA